MFDQLLGNDGQFALFFFVVLLAACLLISVVLTIGYAIQDQTRVGRISSTSLSKYRALLWVMIAVGVTRAAAPAAVLFGITSGLDAVLELLFHGTQFVPAALLASGIIAAFIWQLSLLGHVSRIEEYTRANPGGDQWPRLKLGAGGLSDFLASRVIADLLDRSILGRVHKRMARNLAAALGGSAPDVLGQEYKDWRKKNPPPVSQVTWRAMGRAATSHPTEPRRSTNALIQVILEDDGSPFLSRRRVRQIIDHHN